MEALGAGVAVVMALGVGRFALWLGPRYGIVDVADGELKRHSGAPVPLGGLAILVGVQAGLAVADAFDLGLLAASLLLFSIGLTDDVKGLAPLTRLFGVTVAGVVLVILSDREFGQGEEIFWVVAVVVVVNAINLFDGLDALAGSVSTVAVLGITWFGFIKGAGSPWLGLVIAGCFLGFLFWNRPRARLFLGDNGAYQVGLLLVWLGMMVSPDRMAGVVAVGLVGIPLIDLGVTVFRRGLAGRPLFSGDRDHTYDRLYTRGFSEASLAIGFSVLEALWITAVLVVSLSSGDLRTATTAVIMGAVLTGLVGVWMTVSEA